ncbi:hypothetical protein [Acetobacter estunensis]|uniref:hypothetical protein n=1 Tax=Acetobacter estunensis TaxID=104097 RepID=UPI001C2DD800|nr:hypothetical protein [Acetobacter estunensis]MBV1837169.1 hypothetical protein [Acetobacter estunensis]
MSKTDLPSYVSLVVSWFSTEGINVDPNSDEIFNLAHYIMAKKHPPELPNFVPEETVRLKNLESKKVKIAISTIHDVFPRWIENGEKVLLDLRKDPMKDMLVEDFEKKTRSIKGCF